MPNVGRKFHEYRNELLQRLDFMALYREFGVDIRGNPCAKGWVPCCGHPALCGEDRNPSAQINIHTGVYIDFRDNNSMSFWDFLVAIGLYPDWKEAQKAMAERVDLKPPRVSKKHPAYGVKWKEWRPESVQRYCQMKPPITVEGLRRSGAMLCKRFNDICLAWEIFDHELNVIGYYFVRANGMPFEHESAKGAKSIAKRFDGASGGLIGKPGVQAAVAGKMSNLFWCEGGPDMFAAYSRFPEATCFVSNANGTKETVTENQRNLVGNSGANLRLIADADNPGVDGAEKRWRAVQPSIADMDCVAYRVEDFEVVEKHGKDLRDLLHENEEITDIDKLMQHLVVLDVEHVIDPAAEQHGGENAAFMQYTDRIMVELGLDALSIDTDGMFFIDSINKNRRRKFNRLSEFSYHEGVALAGADFMRKVAETRDEAEELGKITLSDLTKCIAERLSRTENFVASHVGNGIWSLGPDDEIYIVNSGKFHRFDGQEFTRMHKNCIHKHITDINNSKNWVDFDDIKKHLPNAADPDWRVEVHKELDSYVSSWNWRHPHMNELVCGLIYATWMQSMWDWRPNVIVIGESSSGKTELLRMLGRLFLDVARPSGGSTAAGIVQNIGFDSTPVLIDELDNDCTDQKKILGMFRNSGRGTEMLRGTPGQKKKAYSLRHIPWLSGIHMASDAQADKNRMIELDLMKCKDFSLNIPRGQEAYDLGCKILACVLTIAKDALRLYQGIQEEGVKLGEFSRYHESYNVAYASLGAMINADAESMIGLMREYFSEYVDKNIRTSEVLNDQESLLTDILSCQVGWGGELCTAWQALTNVKYMHIQPSLVPRGLAVRDTKKHGRRLILCPRMLTSETGLLAGTEWEGNRGIGRILKRLEQLEPISESTSFAGGTHHCVHFSWDDVDKYVTKKPPETLFDL